MPAALLELIPELALGLIAFAFVVSYCAGRGLLVMWQRTFGWMLEGIAGFLHFETSILHRHIGFDFGGPFRAANNGVQNAIEGWIRGSEEGMARTLRAMTAVAEAGLRATEWLATETAQTFDWLIGTRLPRWLKAAAIPLLLPLLAARLLRLLLPHVKSVVVKPVKVIERTLPGKTITIVKRVGAAAIPGAVTIPALWKEIHGLTKRNLRILKRLRRVEALLGVTGLAIAMANVFGLPNWRCLTRGNVGRTMRALCGTPTRLLDDLLGLIADVWIVENVCTLIPLLSSAASDVAVPIVDALTVAGAGLCKGVRKPGALQGPTATLPAAVPVKFALPAV